MFIIAIIVINGIIVIICPSSSLKFQACDIANTSLRFMTNAVKEAMLPDCEVFKKCLLEGSHHKF